MKKTIRTFETCRMFDHEVVRYADPELTGLFGEQRDLAKLNLPPEARPVMFRCGVLTRSQRRRVNEIGNEKAQLLAAFRFAILEIRDIPQSDGTRISWSPQRSQEGAQIDDAALDALEEFGFGEPDFWEIGSVVVANSFLGLGAPVYVPQLPSSALAWVAMRSRCRAEQSQATGTEE